MHGEENIAIRIIRKSQICQTILLKIIVRLQVAKKINFKKKFCENKNLILAKTIIQNTLSKFDFTSLNNNAKTN